MVLSLFLSAQGQVEHQYTIEDEQPTDFSPDTETADGVEPEPSVIASQHVWTSWYPRLAHSTEIDYDCNEFV